MWGTDPTTPPLFSSLSGFITFAACGLLLIYGLLGAAKLMRPLHSLLQSKKKLQCFQCLGRNRLSSPERFQNLIVYDETDLTIFDNRIHPKEPPYTKKAERPARPFRQITKQTQNGWRISIEKSQNEPNAC